MSAGWGTIPLLCVVAAFGILLESIADTGGRAAAWWADLFFWAGLAVIFIPLTYYAILPRTSRAERVITLTLLGVALYLVKYLQYPLGFSQYDEFQHWRSALDLAQSGHLFTQNTLLPVSALFPGLEIVTNALASIAGIPIFAAATLLIGVARVLTMLALFLFAESVSRSSRIAAIATVAFLGNPLFLFFDAQFAYESLALPLAICAIFVVLRYSQADGADRWIWLAILWGLIAAITVTHHLTSYALLGLLALWSIVRFAARRIATEHPRPLAGLIGSVELGLLWLIIVGALVVQYLAKPIALGVRNVLGIILQENTTRALFHDGAGSVTPLWQQILSFAGVGLLTLCVVGGCYLIWRTGRASVTVLTLGALSLAYPASQALRLTKNGASIATRPMDFFFVAVAFVVALVIIWVEQRKTPAPAWGRTALPLAGLTIILAGGVALGSGPSWARLPGPHIVEGNQRSWGPEDISAAQWSLTYLGSGHRVATDQDDALLMGTYGMQTIVTPSQGVDLADVYFTPGIGPFQRTLLRRAHVRYIVIDQRLASALPASGVYYISGEGGVNGLSHPISLQALTKYDVSPGIDRIYDSGNMVIYDAESVTSSEAGA